MGFAGLLIAERDDRDHVLFVVVSVGRYLIGVVLRCGCADVCAFALFADEAEELDGSCAGGSEPVGGAGVEFGGLAGSEDEVVMSEDEAEFAAEDEGPVVAFVGA